MGSSSSIIIILLLLLSLSSHPVAGYAGVTLLLQQLINQHPRTNQHLVPLSLPLSLSLSLSLTLRQHTRVRTRVNFLRCHHRRLRGHQVLVKRSPDHTHTRARLGPHTFSPLLPSQPPQQQQQPHILRTVTKTLVRSGWPPSVCATVMMR